MRDTTKLFKRLLELDSEAKNMEEQTYAPTERVGAWQISSASLLRQLCGDSHLYFQAFQKETSGLTESNDSSKSRIKHGRAILEAIIADQLAGICFDADSQELSVGGAELSGVLLRVEQLLQQLIQLLQNQK